MWAWVLMVPALAGPQMIKVQDSIGQPIPSAIVLYDDTVSDVLEARLTPNDSPQPRSPPFFAASPSRVHGVDTKGRWTVDCQVVDCVSETPRLGWVVAPGYEPQAVVVAGMRGRMQGVTLKARSALAEGWAYGMPPDDLIPVGEIAVTERFSGLPSGVRAAWERLLPEGTAERGAAWDRTCVATGLPHNRFVFAAHDGRTWLWIYETGGFGTSMWAVYVRADGDRWVWLHERPLAGLPQDPAAMLQASGWTGASAE